MDYKRCSSCTIVGGLMLTTRASKRKGTPFSIHDLRFDILDEGKQIGTLVYDRRDMGAAITLDGKSYTAQYSTDEHDEMLYQTLIRVLSGGAKPPANPYALKDANGGALAEQTKQGFAVGRGEEGFTLRKASFFSRPYHLYRAGADQSLGWIGQKKFFTTTLTMDLPAGFDAPFQVFLLALLLNQTIKASETSSP